ncbi:MAG: STIV orfB116 family protein [Patescibacteria group bacterium]
MLYVCNSFSIQMLDINNRTEVVFQPLTKEEVIQELSSGFKSALGHEDTAQVVSNDLDLTVEFNREFISIDETDQVIVAQIEGGRLPEGSTTLPSDFNLKYYMVEVKKMERKLQCKSCGHIDTEKRWTTVRSGDELICLDADKKNYLPCPGCGEDVNFEIF